MARVYEEKVVIRLSTILKDSEEEPKKSFLTNDQRATLLQALEGLVDDPTIVVEL